MLWHKKTPECNSRNKTHSNGIARRKLTSITASPFTASVVIFRILRFPNIDWRAIVPLLTKHSHQNPAYCDYSETEKERERRRKMTNHRRVECATDQSLRVPFKIRGHVARQEGNETQHDKHENAEHRPRSRLPVPKRRRIGSPTHMLLAFAVAFR